MLIHRDALPSSVFRVFVRLPGKGQGASAVRTQGRRAAFCIASSLARLQGAAVRPSHVAQRAATLLALPLPKLPGTHPPPPLASSSSPPGLTPFSSTISTVHCLWPASSTILPIRLSLPNSRPAPRILVQERTSVLQPDLVSAFTASSTPVHHICNQPLALSVFDISIPSVSSPRRIPSGH